MAKKKEEKKVVENVDIDALVDEGKNIDTVMVSDVFVDKEEDNKEAEPITTVDLTEETKDAQANDITKDVMTDTTENNGEVENNEECNIDDVIAECTGDTDVEEQPKKEKIAEPWYVARAKRINDYYNW